MLAEQSRARRSCEERSRAELTNERIGVLASDDGEERNRCAAVQQHGGIIVYGESESRVLVQGLRHELGREERYARGKAERE